MPAPEMTGIGLLHDYTRGEQLRADDVNALIGIARRQVRMGGRLADPDAADYERVPRSSPRQNVGYPFKNTDASENAPPGAVLQPKVPLSIEDEWGHEINQPSGVLCVPMLVSDIHCTVPKNSFGQACWATQGAWCAWEGDNAPVFAERWGVKSGSWKLGIRRTGEFFSLGNLIEVAGDHFARFVQILAPKKFSVTKSMLSHGGSCMVERIQRKDDNSGWERSGKTYKAYDIFMNATDTTEPGVVVSTVSYCGLEVVDGIYCNVADWLGYGG